MIEILCKVDSVEVIAVGRSIRTLNFLQKRFGRGRWRKMKGVATIRDHNGAVLRNEIHWYEAHGIGRVLIKRKENGD